MRIPSFPDVLVPFDVAELVVIIAGMTKLLFGFLAVFICALVLAQDNKTPVVTRTWTNRVERVLSVVSSDIVRGTCAECGQPNHHDRELRLMTAYDQVYTEIVFGNRTNSFLVGTGTNTNWVQTNIVFRFQPRQPGSYQPPPLPPSTNVTTLTP